ncbi:ROK family transcriptional regulator [Actinocrinis puniceicyclus]|uniref:ROK family transcriptional regulator n=1 Tax=Actinocrinis puniceicyclus TaxID=977794 RepID=A0A8J7WPI2_9ACTN|nr:ROK family transcriptional regulator [Actinocrinis puniceicyclus]MBS2963527.1 ROK family transcriptional regulator [Actinocrinis puniceicyclus]
MAERVMRTVRDLRRSNRSLLLRRLYFDGPLSRQDLIDTTTLSAASVSNVVGDLIGDGLVAEVGSVGSEGGRPRILLQVDCPRWHAIGVDVGETRVLVELFTLDLAVLAREEYPLPDGCRDVAAVVDRIDSGLRGVLAAGAVRQETIIGVGVGVPGVVAHSPELGAVVHGQTIGWDAVPLERLLREAGGVRAHLPLYIDNGATTLGQAEMWFGAGRGARDAVIALIGSGVGACVVVDGAPYRGTGRSAGEWGHTTVQVGGRSCRCGARGCLEAYVGAEAVIERFREVGPAGSPSGPPAEASEEGALAAILAAQERGEPAAAAVLEETAVYLGVGVANLINLFNPERIALGGWAGLLLGARLLPRVREVAREYALRHAFANVELSLCQLGPDAVARGAATLPVAGFLAAGSRPPRNQSAS